jgi:hypothetical protein
MTMSVFLIFVSFGAFPRLHIYMQSHCKRLCSQSCDLEAGCVSLAPLFDFFENV